MTYTTITPGMTGAQVRAAINDNMAILENYYLGERFTTILSTGLSYANFIAAINSNFSDFSKLIALTTTEYTALTTATENFQNVLAANYTVMEGKGDTFLADGKTYFLHLKQATIPNKGAANILSQQGEWKLAYYASENTLYLSNDCGVTWPYSKAYPENEELISLAHVFSNGNVLLGSGITHKLYHSLDLLSTLTEFTCTDDKTGLPLEFHVPVNASYPGDYFGALNSESHFQDGQEILIFGNYPHHNTITENTASDRGAAPIKLYMSDDQGATLRCIYHFGQNPTERDNGLPTFSVTGNLLGDPTNSTYCKHYHFTGYEETRKEFWLQIGDDNDTTWWFKVKYNATTKAVTITEYAMGALSAYFRAVGLRFTPDGAYAIWGSDGNGNIYKVDYTHLTTALTNHTLKYDSSYFRLGISSYAEKMLSIGHSTDIQLDISLDYGENWENVPYAYRQDLLQTASVGLFKLINADDNGYYLLHRTAQVIPLNAKSSWLVKIYDKPIH